MRTMIVLKLVLAWNCKVNLYIFWFMHSTPYYHLKSGHPMKHRTLHEKCSIYEVFVVEKNQIVPIRCFKDIFSRGNVQSLTDFINYVKAALSAFYGIFIRRHWNKSESLSESSIKTWFVIEFLPMLVHGLTKFSSLGCSQIISTWKRCLESVIKKNMVTIWAKYSLSILIVNMLIGVVNQISKVKLKAIIYTSYNPAILCLHLGCLMDSITCKTKLDVTNNTNCFNDVHRSKSPDLNGFTSILSWC